MTQLKFKIKRSDYVEVISGNAKGKRGTVSKIDLKKSCVYVSGVGEYVRHIKPSQTYPEGKVTKQRPIHISNVALVDPSTDLSGKVGYKIDLNGQKIRFFKESGEVLQREIEK